VAEEGEALIDGLTTQFVNDAHAIGCNEKSKPKQVAKADKELDSRLRKLWNELVKLNRDQGILDREYDQYAFTVLKDSYEKARVEARTALNGRFGSGTKRTKPKEYAVTEEEQLAILKCFARLDGYDLVLRGVETKQREQKRVVSEDNPKPDDQTLAWVTPVRTWARLDSWGNDPDTQQEITKPTHDAEGNVDPAYLQFLVSRLNVFSDDGTVKEEFHDRLDPDCIEAADLMLSAGRHKPFVFAPGDHERPAALIRKLDGIHSEIRAHLAGLLQRVEERV